MTVTLMNLASGNKVRILMVKEAYANSQLYTDWLYNKFTIMAKDKLNITSHGVFLLITVKV